ncbi:uncharacterized protein LOC143895410 [Temnothorax americanus]|uniref:uncharacterized protein LOC143895410 n=1 Tax=Temnothorax americanus TaxID=1964332 RepID=UPI004068B1AB
MFIVYRKTSHKKVWEQIAQVMNSKRYTVTGRQCTPRVNTMKRTYKAVRDHNRQSGNNKRPWKYFEMMESLLGEKPFMEPPATISSTGAETFKIKSEPANLTFISGLSSSGSGSSICENEASNKNICVSRKSACNFIIIVRITAFVGTRIRVLAKDTTP